VYVFLVCLTMCHIIFIITTWLGGTVVRALDLRLEVAGSIPAAALLSATLDKLFTYIVQRLWCYNLINVKKTYQFKTVFNGDIAYLTQLKQQKSKKVLLPMQHVAVMSTGDKNSPHF